MSSTLALRRAGPADSHTLWEWRNAPDVRATAFSPDPISWEDHERWFARKIADPLCLLFIAEDDEAPLGQIRFDVGEGGTEAEISVSVQRAHRRRGVGTALIEEGIQAAAAEGLRTVHAYIKPENEASVRAFVRAGFVSAGTTEVRGAEALHYIWHRETA